MLLGGRDSGALKNLERKTLVPVKKSSANQPPSFEVAKSMALPMGSSPPAALAALEAAMMKKFSTLEGGLLYGPCLNMHLSSEHVSWTCMTLSWVTSLLY